MTEIGKYKDIKIYKNNDFFWFVFNQKTFFFEKSFYENNEDLIIFCIIEINKLILTNVY